VQSVAWCKAKIRIFYISSTLKWAYPEIVGFNFVAQFSQKDGILVHTIWLAPCILDSMCGRQDFCVESLSCLFVSRKCAERLLFFTISLPFVLFYPNTMCRRQDFLDWIVMRFIAIIIAPGGKMWWLHLIFARFSLVYNLYIYVYIYTHTHIYIYIYIYIYISMYIYQGWLLQGTKNRICNTYRKNE